MSPKPNHRVVQFSQLDYIRYDGLAKLIVATILITLTALVTFHNSHGGDFCFDDHYAIKGNPDVVSNNSLLDIWTHDFWGQDIQKLDSHKSYRPITVLSFRLNYWINENIINPVFFDADIKDERGLLLGMHLTNTLLHAICSVMVFVISRRVVFLSFKSSVGAGILFASHPIHTEAVSNIVGRAEMISAIFSMAALILYSKACNNIDLLKSLVQVIISIILGWLSILSKESAFAIFPLLALWDILFIFDNPRRLDKRFLVRLAFIAFGIGCYLYARVLVTIHFTVLNYRRLENPIAFASSIKERWLSTLYLHGRYILALVKPWPLSCDWSFNCIPLVDSFLDSRNLLWIAFYSCIVAGLIISVFLYRYRHPLGRAYIFLLGFAALSFAPASNVLLFVGTMLAERILYIPSIAFCIILSDLFKSIGSFTSSKLVFIMLVIITASFYAKISIDRNQDWKDETSLFEAANKVCPNSGKVAFNMAVLRLNAQRFDEAEDFLVRARKIEPHYCELDYQHALLEMKGRNNIPKAIYYLNQAINCVHTKVNAVLALKGIYELLIESSAKENTPQLLEQWSDILVKVDHGISAIEYYHKSATGYYELKDIKSVKRCILKALKIDPNNKNTILWMKALKSSKII